MISLPTYLSFEHYSSKTQFMFLNFDSNYYSSNKAVTHWFSVTWVLILDLLNCINCFAVFLCFFSYQLQLIICFHQFKWIASMMSMTRKFWLIIQDFTLSCFANHVLAHQHLKLSWHHPLKSLKQTSRNQWVLAITSCFCMMV